MKGFIACALAGTIIAALFVLLVSCSDHQKEFDKVSRSIDKQIEMVGAMNRTIDAITKETDEAIEASKRISSMVNLMDDRWTGNDKWTHASLILSNISGKDRHKAQTIISNLCRSGRISHSSHKIWIDAYVYVETEREKRESKRHEQAYIQEFRQNIADLQNRVYELENK